jgi:hypothetical protein
MPENPYREAPYEAFLGKDFTKMTHEEIRQFIEAAQERRVSAPTRRAETKATSRRIINTAKLGLNLSDFSDL